MNWFYVKWLWIIHLPVSGMLGVLLYWLPFTICVVGYVIRTCLQYQHERTLRDKYDNPPPGTGYLDIYYPRLRLRTIVGRAIVSIIPFVNIIAAVFNVAPKMLASFYNWCVRILDTPLVPPRKKPKV
jgi:hypothetical protein